MKKLYVLRHAKAGKSNKKILDDHERPLTGKGLESCQLITNYFSRNNESPDMVLCSTAKRTRETYEEVFKKYMPMPEVKYDSRLYLASVGDIFSIARETPDKINSLMIVGHNPGLHEFALLLSGKPEKPLIKKMKDYFPPGSLAIFEISGVWSNLERKDGTLTDFISPKNLD